MPVPNFCQFGELQTLGPNFLKKYEYKNFEKINIKIKMSV